MSTALLRAVPTSATPREKFFLDPRQLHVAYVDGSPRDAAAAASRGAPPGDGDGGWHPADGAAEILPPSGPGAAGDEAPPASARAPNAGSVMRWADAAGRRLDELASVVSGSSSPVHVVWVAGPLATAGPNAGGG